MWALTAATPAWRWRRLSVRQGGSSHLSRLGTTACLEETGRVNGLDHLVALPFALSNAPEPVVLRFPTERGMIDSQLSGDGRIEMATVIAVALDAIWNGIADGNSVVHGIKMDIQGMELERCGA